MKQKEKKAISYTLFVALIMVITLSIAVYTKYKAVEDISVRKADSGPSEALTNSVLISAPRRGALNPTVVVAEFGDFECPYCKLVSPTIKEVLHKYPKNVQQVWIHTIGPTHPQAELAAIASQCAQEQNRFWDYHDSLYQNQDNLSPALYNQIATSVGLNLQEFQECLADPRIQQVVQLHNQFAQQSNIDATPYLLINETTISGAFTADELEAAIISNL